MKMTVDVRCRSLKAAVRFARRCGLLGLVTEATPVVRAPNLVKLIKETGLLVFTYGEANNTVKEVKLQQKAGVDAVIVDSVLAVRRELQQEQREDE